MINTKKEWKELKLTDKLISFKKIEFEGSASVRKEEYYNVAGVAITVREEKMIDYTPDEIDCENPEIIDKKSYWCTCKACSIKPKTQGNCVFVKSLKAWMKLKRHKGGIRF